MNGEFCCLLLPRTAFRMGQLLLLVLLCVVPVMGQKPQDVVDVEVVNRTETELTLEWNKVDNNNSYSYVLMFSNGTETNIPSPDNNPVVTHIISFLSPGTKYSFTLYTEFNNVRSSGYNFTNVTAPSNVEDISVVNRTETELTLEWNKVNNDNNNSYSYVLMFSNGTETDIPSPDNNPVVTHIISFLSPGTKYSFTLYTEFDNVRSSGYNFTNVTAPSNVEDISVVKRTETELKLQWNKVDNDNNNSYSYVLMFSNGTETDIPSPDNNPVVTHIISFLSPGTKYSFTLYTEFDNVRSSGYNFTNVTAPSNVEDISVVNRTETELKLQWNKVDNDNNNSYSYVLMFSNGTETNIPSPDNNPVVTHIISFLSPGTKYSFTLYTEFDNVRSSGYNFTNVTAPSNVEDISVVNRTETELKLKWNKVNNDNNNSYSYVLMFSNGTETNIPSPDNNPVVTHIISFLSPGTKYSFTLYTEFDNVRSSGYNFTNVTVPSNVVNASAVQSNDTAMILQWNTVTNTDNTTYNYTLKYSTESWEETLSINPEGNSVVRHQISDLIPATTYSFILYTIFDDVKSKGFTFTSSTTLSDVSEVRVTERSQTELTVEWDKLNKNSIYNYTLSHKDGIKVHFVGSEPNDVIRHTLSGLKPGTLYEFILNTVVKNQESRGFIFKNITTINCTSIAWNVTNSSIDADHVFGSTHVTAKNRTDDEVNKPVEQNRVNLQNLYPGATYTVSLLYHLESQQLLQCSQRLTLVPNSVSRLSCSSFSGGYGLTVVWEAPIGVVDVVQVDVAGKTFNQSGSRQEVDGLQVAQWYTVKATSFSRDMKSSTVSINCQTDPTGVIAGVLVFVLLVLLICAGVFLWRHKKKNVGGSKQHVESNVSRNKVYKPIPADKFPEHFHNLSRDENMGFSEEYEELGLVGLELSRDTAKMPENKSKNRFSNVLAYDVSRVRLSIDDNGDSDYINANYMPGYAGARKQYIAAQGPLPTTINDFWRMIWERRSQTIVMVTNCIERGSTKCEQYWPLDYTPCLYGNLLVTVTSEEKAQSWTLREFTVNNKDTSETRTVRHFHFTAWPDHGVPLGTEELITFRGLVRQHIESSSSAGPTVVHCSAGVGRTGTLIALDVMLQQLDRNRAVGIADFVQKMRLHRPLMVQTESQYVFLHQCIIDSLQPKDIPKPQEPLYENSDMIFANAMALKEYNKVSKNV